MAQVVKFLSDSDQIEFTVMESPTPTENDVPNVSWKKTQGGKERAVKYGESVRLRGFRILLNEDTAVDETLWDAFITSLSGYSLTFYFVDHNGDAFTTARFNAPPKKVRAKGAPGYKFVDMEVLEVL